VARKVVAGELDLAMVPSRAWDTEGVTTLRALNAPFLVTSDELLDRVVTSDLAEEMLAGLDDAGVVGLALLPENLRHPFAFGEPLLSPDDYAGALIRAPRSDVAYALFEALGARPDDLPGDAFGMALENGSVAAAESAFELAGSLPQQTVATGNITFFPKVNSLVINADVHRGLDAGERDIIERAAERTRAWAVDATPSDVEAARTWCNHHGIVLASDPDLAALERATAPVYAELERDSQTKRLIARIRELKSELAVSAVEPCSARAQSSARPTDTAGLIGVWRTHPTYEEGIAAGLPAGVAEGEMGVQTIRMEAGTYEWTWQARNGKHVCPGRYEVAGDVVTFTDVGPCQALWEARFRLVGDEIRWSAVKSHAGEPVDQILRELLHKPWKRIG
jgi:TRAP-type C4-dicarboxylate transport system substrate-binding protein